MGLETTMGNSITVTVANRRVKLKNLVAEGGYGYIYRAEEEGTKKQLALKMMRVPCDKNGTVVSAEAASVAKKEQEICMGLGVHPNIVQYYGSATQRNENEICFSILCEFCPETILAALSAARTEGRYMSENDIMWILRDTLLALLHLHSQSPPIAHRDVKVENLLVGEDGCCKLCDFGSCSTVHQTYKGARAISIASEEIRKNTTAAYRAPEQVDLHQGYEVNEKVDIWAAGVLLYKLAFFKTPFEDIRGDVESLGILNGFSRKKVPADHPFSPGLIDLMEYCMDPNPSMRPTVGQVLKRCEIMHLEGRLPYWQNLGTLSRTPPSKGDPAHFSAESGLRQSLPSATIIAAAKQGSRGAVKPAPNAPVWKSATAPIKVSSKPPSPRSGEKVPGGGMVVRIGEGVMSKWYKLLGGEQRKRLWVLKTTSRRSCGPKPKYVRLIVIALWENDLTLGGFFQLLRYRPLAESPVVALKALTTILKVLQQGPPQCLSECSTYADVVDEIGQMWSSKEDRLLFGFGDEAADPNLVQLIGMLANTLVLKVRFHQHHPEYGDLFTVLPAAAKDCPIPVAEDEGAGRVMSVISRLLEVQQELIVTGRQSMTVVEVDPREKGSASAAAAAIEGVAPSASLLLPLAEESYLTWVATTRLMINMGEQISDSGDDASGHLSEKLVSLRSQYESQLGDLRDLFARLDKVPEVRAMRRTPVLPSSSPIGTGSPAILVASAAAADMGSAYGRFTSKQQALVALKREERIMNQVHSEPGVDLGRSPQPSSPTGAEEEDDDIVSDDEVEIQELQVDSGWADFDGVDWSQLPPPSPGRTSPVVPLDASSAAKAFLAQGQGALASRRPQTEAPKVPGQIEELLVDTSDADSNSVSPGPSAAGGEIGSALDVASAAAAAAVVAAASQAAPPPPPKPPLDEIYSDFETLAVNKSTSSNPSDKKEGAYMPPLPIKPGAAHLHASALLIDIDERLKGDIMTPPPLPPRRIGVDKAETPPPPLPPRSDSSTPVLHKFHAEGLVHVDFREGTGGTTSSSPSPRRDRSRVAGGCGQPQPLNVAAARMQQREAERAARSRKQHREGSGPRTPSGGSGIQRSSSNTRPKSGARMASSQIAAKHGERRPSSVKKPLGLKIAIARYNYVAQGNEQISFKVNDIIKLHSDKVNGKGWGLGEIDGKMGWFPGDFVSFRPLPEEVPMALREKVSRLEAGATGGDAGGGAGAAVDDLRNTALVNGAQVHRGGKDEDMLPEHQFAIQMARAQPWKDRLTPGGKLAYAELIQFFQQSGAVIDFGQIHLKGVIGSGAFATVFKAVYRNHEVAVKKLVGGGGGPMERTLKDFKSEAALLNRLRHRNIIANVGSTTDPVTLVMEYCSRGNLMVLLNDTTIELTWPMKKQMCTDIAMGMKYLHNQNPVIIHRDLKSLNVLIDENWVTKVTDFGLSRFKATSVSEKMTGQAGTYHWMAPEVINSQHYTEKADVFSFGIILWEIYTRAIPYDGMQPVQVVAAVLGRRERPRIPSRCPQQLAILMQQCWHHDPNQRPPFSDIVPWLQNLP